MPDIVKGRTFSSGESVTHSKLNDLLDNATISTAFITGKATLVSYDAANCSLIFYDSASGTFKRGTLQASIFDSDALIKSRSATTMPADTWVLPIQDPAGGIYKVTRANLFYQWASISGLIDPAGALGNTAGTALKVNVDGVTIEISTNALRLTDGGTELAKLSTTAKRNLAGAVALFCDQQTAATVAQSSSGSATTDTLRLNTTLANTLTGASLSANQIALAAGRYETEFEVPVINGVGGYAELYNVTDAAVQTSTSSAEIRGLRATGLSGGDTIRGRGIFEIAASKVFELRARTTSASTYGTPLNLNSKDERYQFIQFRQAY